MKLSHLRIPILLISILFFITQFVPAQEKEDSPKLGFSVSLQDNQLDFLVPILIGSKATISPAFGMMWMQDAGTDLHVGIVPKIYFYRDKVSPFIGIRAAILRTIPTEGEGTTDYLIGLMVGGEYFIDKNFSFGVESQFNFTISDNKSTRFGNPGKNNFNTAAVIFASVYF